ncbi:Ldh family oxidoreductase [Saccharothrix luteola]|uniref:Ldh family oxidoreductase n=1 Tax=Saccharothrix luteola TaxID=2893018 RepID=UPI001E5A29A2|nr:Ldh family oxidoreductase [Saccharothrix luteola]MCC8249295.1 Ldh family oxidoreductase [Saccharothrix luteola]
MKVTSSELTKLAVRILLDAGTNLVDAKAVAGSLVESNLTGHDSHGVRRLVDYVARIRDGRIDPRARPGVDHPRPGTVVVRGNRALGRIAAGVAARELRALTRTHGSGVAVIQDCNHVGRLGEYVGFLAEHDLVALAFGNADATVAPHGGRERRLGTNPLAWAAPRAADRPPIVVDWATSGVAEGKLAVARDRGERVPEGLVLDPDGRPTTDPGDFYAGGALLPFGGHKGYGLSVLIEVVGGLLTGMGIGSLPGYRGGFGTVLVAVDIGSLTPVERFREQAELFCRELTGTPPAHGSREVLVPGEPEARTRRARLRDGIPMTGETWRELHGLLTAKEGTT